MQQRRPSGHHEKHPPTLARLLKSEREAAGLTRQEMADQLGVSRPHLTRLEAGQHKQPSPALLGRIAKRLDVSPDDLYALAGYLPSDELPSFVPYLRAMHPEWPDSVITMLGDIHDCLSCKYSPR